MEQSYKTCHDNSISMK